MKILIFNWRDVTSPFAGGAEVYAHEIAKKLSREHEVTLFCGKYKGCKEEDEIDGVRIIRKGGTFSVYLRGVFKYLLELRKENYDVVIDCINAVPFFTPLYVRKPKVAILHHLNRRRIIFLELPFPHAVIAWVAEKLVSYLYRRAIVITVSPSSKNELIESGIPEDSIHIIYNSIDYSAFGPGNKSEKPTIAYLGRIKKYKRLDHLLAAFNIVRKELPDVRLLIAGRGDYDRVKKEVVKLEIAQYVTLIGEVSEYEKAEILKEAWLFVTPSIKEGWGVSVIEAAACGTPAIAYDVPGLRDSIKNNNTGILVQNENINDLASAIVNVLQDSELRAKYSENSLEWASTFNWERSACEFMNVLDKAMLADKGTTEGD